MNYNIIRIFKKSSLVLFAMLQVYSVSQAQINMYIHKKVGGTEVIPVANVDSIVYYATKPILNLTEVASSITTTTATSGGSISADGGEPINVRGVCWNTTSSPTIADKITEDGSGTGSFISNLTGLSPNTTYYVRSYATNSKGTAYGTQTSFTCLREYLNALSLKSGGTGITLSPAFEKTISAYTATVANSVSSLTVTPTSESSTATITVNGISAVSGSPLSVNLNVGANSIAITVYEDGIVQQTYSISVTRLSNANLISLYLKSGETNVNIAPSFSKSNLAYSANVDYEVSAITILPTTESATSTISVNGSVVASGSASIPIFLSTGINYINVDVNDNGNVQSYIITVTRHTSANLNTIILKSGKSSYNLTPPFSKTHYTYGATIPMTSAIVTPTPEDIASTVTCNGSIVPTTVNLLGGVNQVTIRVTSTSGQVKTYTIEITR